MRSPSVSSQMRWFVLAMLAFVLATLVDPWAYLHLASPRIYETDLGRMLRIAGFLPTWAIVSGALVASDAAWLTPTSRWRRWRGALPVISAALAGALGELLKLLLRRERPDMNAGAYAFRSWHEHPLATAGLALPSSHAIVAFGALVMLSLMYPRARWIFYGLAIGCAATRVLSHAHYLSDVVLSAIAGSTVAVLLWRAWTRRESADLLAG